MADLFRFIWTHPEVEHKRIRSIVRALTWQIWERTLRIPWPVHLSPDISLLCYPHSTSAASVLYCRYPEWREMRFLLDYLTPGDTFLDVGANVGVYFLLASTLPDVQTWAFEPSTLAAERAAENIRRNRLEARCRLLRVAVGDKNDQGYLTVGLDTMNRVTPRAEPESPDAGAPPPTDIEPIDIVSLDTTIPPSTQTAVALIKIDVEGEELAVLQGATELLQRSSPVLIIEENDTSELPAFLNDLHYVQCNYDPGARELLTGIGPFPGQRNVLYVRDVDAVRDRLTIPPSRTQ